jgi:hypothetical protein
MKSSAHLRNNLEYDDIQILLDPPTMSPSYSINYYQIVYSDPFLFGILIYVIIVILLFTYFCVKKIVYGNQNIPNTLVVAENVKDLEIVEEDYDYELDGEDGYEGHEGLDPRLMKSVYRGVSGYQKNDRTLMNSANIPVNIVKLGKDVSNPRNRAYGDIEINESEKEPRKGYNNIRDFNYSSSKGRAMRVNAETPRVPKEQRNEKRRLRSPKGDFSEFSESNFSNSVDSRGGNQRERGYRNGMKNYESMRDDEDSPSPQVRSYRYQRR